MANLITSKREIVDISTGETHQEIALKVEKKKTPYFIRWFYEDIGTLFHLTASSKDVLWMIVMRMNSENKIALDQDEINELCKMSLELPSTSKIKPQLPLFERPKKEVKEKGKEKPFEGYSERVVRKSIDQLYLAGILIRINKGKYMIHPNIATKTTDREVELAKLSLNYDNTGKRYLITEFTLKSNV